MDGGISDDSRWIVMNESGCLELRWQGVRPVAGIHFHSGFREEDAFTAFRVLFWRDGASDLLPSARFHFHPRFPPWGQEV